jgi:hypothetical protein
MPGGTFAVRLDNPPGVFTKANAHLLAAAPDMLDALLECVIALDPANVETIAQVQRAIALATQPQD